MFESRRDEHWPSGVVQHTTESMAKYNWTVMLYNGRVLCGEVTLLDATESEARTWSHNACRKPITGALLKSRDVGVVRFGSMAKESW